MNKKEELYNRIELLRAELGELIKNDMDMTRETVINKNRELNTLLLEYQKKYM